MPTNYQPTDVDIEWAGNMLDMIADGGTLAYPATKMIYLVDKTNKKLILQNVEQLAVFSSFVIHEQTKVVFAEHGYKVEERRG